MIAHRLLLASCLITQISHAANDVPPRAAPLITVLHNAAVHTMDEERMLAEAFAYDAAGVIVAVGSLGVGLQADYVVVDRNLFDIAPHQIGDSEVLLTVFGGEVVHRSARFR